ncbi:hypothetical protein [Sorangium sp. So ce1000]|uniref:hypothetical protein n=1 Tax=Sorangium sp. So ce1000 TaxID=3133325 RepID=UPI003F5E0F69
MPFARIQFVAYEIYTGPTPPTNGGGKRRYVGQASITTDIQERVALMKEAIEKAAASPHIDTRSGTLKLFMAPEFYFRGPGGAYKLDDIVGVGRSGTSLVRQLSDLVRVNKWSQWMFVFGTAMGFSERDSHSKWDYILPNYSWFPGSKAWRDYYKEVYNVALVQLGGGGSQKNAESRRRVVMKEHRSDIDFLEDPQLGIALDRALHLSPGKKPGIGKEQQSRNDDGASIFSLADTTYGLEVCLDHLEERLARSPPAKGQDEVQVQVIPSAGMSINNDAVAVTRNGLVFHCDGLGNGLKKPNWRWGAHSAAIVAARSPVTMDSERTPIGVYASEQAHASAAAVQRVFAAPAVGASIRYYMPADIPMAKKVK